MNNDPLEIKLNSGDVLKFSGPFKDAVFNKTLLPMQFPVDWDSSVDDPISHHSDPYNSYGLNSYNYRGPEFSSDVDILAAGCSFTFGIGVPDNGTWPAIFSEKTGLSVANLSAPAASIEWIVDSILRYVETFGKPKKAIIAYFPDLLRGEVAVDERVTTSEEWGAKDFHQTFLEENTNKKVLSHASLNMVSKDMPAPKILKKPYPIEYTKTKEECIRQSFASIRTLEAFCKAAGISLIWSSWSSDLHEAMDSISNQYKFNNFWPMRNFGEWKSHKRPLEKTKDDPEGIVDYRLDHNESTLDAYGCSNELEGKNQCVCYSTCHFDLADKYGVSFHMATDRFDPHKGIEQAHFGVHKLIHIAESFVAMLDKVEDRETKLLLEEKMEEAEKLDKELVIEFEDDAQEMVVKVVMREGQLRLKEELVDSVEEELEELKKESESLGILDLTKKETEDWLSGANWVLQVIKNFKFTI